MQQVRHPWLTLCAAIRSAKGLTQERLAELADLNLRTVQKVEAGQLNILLTTLIRIQRALKCPWGKLIRE
ncbi:MAG: helix-turn-helix transcriptional regulator [Verrucomicrobiia bacterium]